MSDNYKTLLSNSVVTCYCGRRIDVDGFCQDCEEEQYFEENDFDDDDFDIDWSDLEDDDFYDDIEDDE